MNKASKLALAAFAVSLAYATPTLAAQTTARDFVEGLLRDFESGDLAGAQVKIGLISDHGFEGIEVDHQLMSVARLLELLAGVRGGELEGSRVAASLTNLLNTAGFVGFLAGGRSLEVFDFETASGSQFPAGSAG